MRCKFLKKCGPQLCLLVCFVLMPGQIGWLSANEFLRLQDPGVASCRAPVDVVWMDGFLFTANSKTGTISLMETPSFRCISEWQVSKSLIALERCGDLLLALDDSSHQLLVLKFLKDSAALKLVDRVPVPRYPVDLAVSADGATVAVSSLWSRMLTVFRTMPDGKLTEQNRTQLPFAPRRLLFSDPSSLVIADNFGGQLCVVRAETGRVTGELALYGHNIRGLAINPKTASLMVTCQTLDSRTFTTYERIFWGVLMQNGLHSIPLRRLSEESTSASQIAERETDLQEGGYGSTSNSQYAGTASASQQQYPLGTPSIGSGDPGAMVVTSDDKTLLLISGTSQVAFRTASHLPFERLKTGQRPEAICLDDAHETAFVANRFDDSITVISLQGESPAVAATVSLGLTRPLTAAEQGERVFYDAKVSLDGWFSCHSCHTDGHTNGLLADTFGDEDRGAPKKVISLLGTADAGPWSWNGSKPTLEEQVKTSLIISMQTQLPTEELPISSLSAFLRTLKPAPSHVESAEQDCDKTQMEQANLLFREAGCVQCHGGSAWTSSEIRDVGIHDEMGETRFNPPSLSGVSQRAPYFHDGRAKTLQEVLQSGHHNSEIPLTDEQTSLLEVLLNSL